MLFVQRIIATVRYVSFECITFLPAISVSVHLLDSLRQVALHRLKTCFSSLRSGWNYHKNFESHLLT